MLLFVIMKTACTLKNVEKMSGTQTKGVTRKKDDKVVVKHMVKRSRMNSAAEDANVKQSKSFVALKKEKVNKKPRKVIDSKKKIGKTESTKLIIGRLLTAINMLELTITTLEKETCSQPLGKSF